MDCFDEFEKAGETTILRWVAEGRPEDDFTEFKSGAVLEKGSISKEAKRQLGEEIAGMANGGGGTLIWGVVTKQLNSADIATAAGPIDVIDRVLTAVRGQINNIVQPPVPGIEFAIAKTSSDTTKGYLAVRVPRSERRPHMSTAPGVHSYFMRSGTSTRPMSPYEVEDQMLRQKRAELTATLDMRAKGSVGSATRIFVGVHLNNISEVSALNPYVSAVVRGLRLSGDTSHSFVMTSRVPTGMSFYGEPHMVIPPSGIVQPCKFQFYLAKAGDGSIDLRHPDEVTTKFAGAASIELWYGCRDTQQKHLRWLLNEDQAEDLFEGQHFTIEG